MKPMVACHAEVEEARHWILVFCRRRRRTTTGGWVWHSEPLHADTAARQVTITPWTNGPGRSAMASKGMAFSGMSPFACC